MIIDFHAHVFPEKIAARTISLLSEKGGVPAFSDGTANRLIEKMERADTDISITLPVITNPAQFDSVNRFALEINTAFANKSRRLISFAGIHPDCEDIGAKMDFIKKSGFLGVKIHPDYQGTFIDDDKYVKILECAKENELIVITHAGVDIAYPNDPVRCPPERALRLMRKVPYSKLVLAHLGASEMGEQVLEYLCGEDVYFDTAYVLRFTSEELFKKILKKHGDDKILFASDSPWSDIEKDVQTIRSFSLGKDTEEKIFFKNAKNLLGI